MRSMYLIVLFLLYCSTGNAQGIAMQYQASGHNDSSFIYKVPVPMTTFAAADHKVKQPVPGNFYTQGFGFFCKQELKMYKANVPVSFRLGSMDYCDKLEQKGCSAP